MSQPEILEPADTVSALVPAIPDDKRLAVFTTSNALDPILEAIAAEVRSFTPDLSTAKGRKEIASLAYKVAQSKTHLDSIGKALADEQKAIPKKIDAARKAAWDFLQNLQNEVRKPLDDWEAETERQRASELAKQKAIEMAIEVERDHELALLMNAEFDRKANEALKVAEQERIDREARIAAEAAETARREAEQKAAREKAEALEAAERAKLAQERAERETQEANERAAQAERDAKAQAENAAREAKQQAEREYAEALAHKEARAKAEQEVAEKRAADVEHRKGINRDALRDLVAVCGLDDAKAKAVIIAIASGKIEHVTINY